MLTYNRDTVRTSVRRLVEFALRGGDIRVGSALMPDPEIMQEGSRLHRKIQGQQKATYRSEVPLRLSWDREKYKLVLDGRADGIDKVRVEELNIVDPLKDLTKGCTDHVFLIDEIKCVMKKIEDMEEADPLHLSQAMCYAYMYSLENHLSHMAVQVTYCHLETEEIKRLAYIYSFDELSEWFADILSVYELWADYYVDHMNKRNESIKALRFPFSYRDGQKTMVAMIYQTIKKKESILMQAPTGVGKTMSTIYPALKAMADQMGDHIFYLTAKTITRTAAEDALTILRQQSLLLKSVTITAKEKICIKEDMDCNPETCLRARGHYDRINEAVYALLTGELLLTRECILDYSERYQVCPYELSFEAALWADMVICDYNYVFDPYVGKRTMFGDGGHDQALYLIDEAHNLPDRAREMYSATLDREAFLDAKKIFRGRAPHIAKKLQNCIAAIDKIKQNTAYIEEDYQNIDPDGLYFPLFRLFTPLQDYLKDHETFEGREEAIEFFFSCYQFLHLLDEMEEGYQTYAYYQDRNFHIRIFCVDPSGRLSEYLDQSRSAIFFSATLLPVPYYRKLLGGADLRAYSIPSPFASEKRLLTITEDVTSRYKRRGEGEYRKMVAYLEAMVEKKKGNYMIFFPSYEMLERVLSLAEESTLCMVADYLVQTPDMSEREREGFLEEFSLDRSDRSLVAFCVLGSIFSEGIDLTGRRLIGVCVVGTGLPMVCKEREIIRSYFDIHEKKGYDYAYRYPGMNKALQAAGRVIRTAEDVGLILLMDDRFLLRENQLLLPAEWDHYYAVRLDNFGLVVENFWKRHDF